MEHGADVLGACQSKFAKWSAAIDVLQEQNSLDVRTTMRHAVELKLCRSRHKMPQLTTWRRKSEMCLENTEWFVVDVAGSLWWIL
ncbi:hypothetical protein CVT25_000113 [Psilocybe cyanescens]|uniref:Uncharacterized protein n=1 Tax=Psilocybe cyanescens TaxID=93625 RepID=A0A409XQD7_PSICY|nr:hypothetical protein CVT25_000113 [Psilocybe cyanescens]